jgi:hypothetical protein
MAPSLVTIGPRFQAIGKVGDRGARFVPSVVGQQGQDPEEDDAAPGEDPNDVSTRLARVGPRLLDRWADLANPRVTG